MRKICLKIGVEKAMQTILENHQKSHPKSMPKPSKNHPKTDAKKESIFRGSNPQKPGDPRAPVRVTIGLQKDNKRKTTWRRGVQRGTCRETNLDPLTRLGRLRARSGLYWATGPPGLRGESFHVPSGCSRPASAFRPVGPRRPYLKVHRP